MHGREDDILMDLIKTEYHSVGYIHLVQDRGQG
jgi:hypothetical protein